MTNILTPAMWVKTGDPTTVSETAATAFQIGQVGGILPHKNTTLFDAGKGYRFYQFVLRASADAVTLATAGSPAFWSNYDTFEVTADVSASVGGETAGELTLAGCFPGTSLVAGSYGFIQVGGIGPALLKSSPTGTYNAGMGIYPTTTDLEFDLLADLQQAGAKDLPFGKAITAKDAGSIGTHVVEAAISVTRHGW